MNSKWIIPLKDIPSDLTVEQYISIVTDFNEKLIIFSDEKYDRHLKLKINFDLNKLRKDVESLLKFYPSYSYPYGAAPADPLYKMIYLMHNSQSLNEQINMDFPTEKKKNSSEKILGSDFGKNSIIDTMNILERSKISNELSLKTFLDSFNFTLLRSRLAIHSGMTAANLAKSNLSWHTDEKIFINTRINIPLLSSENFSIEYLKKIDDQEEIKSFDLLEGFAYSLNTGRPHRFLAKNPSDFLRISLICGFSPWFTFDKESQCWCSNEYYGKLHPLEILAQGLVTPFLVKE